MLSPSLLVLKPQLSWGSLIARSRQRTSLTPLSAMPHHHQESDLVQEFKEGIGCLSYLASLLTMIPNQESDSVQEFEERIGCLKNVMQGVELLSGHLPEEAHETRAVQEKLRALQRAADRAKELGNPIHRDVLTYLTEAEEALKKDWNGKAFVDRYAYCRGEIQQDAKCTKLCLGSSMIAALGCFSPLLCSGCVLAYSGYVQRRLEWPKLQRHLKKIIPSLDTAQSLIAIETTHRPVASLPPNGGASPENEGSVPAGDGNCVIA